MNPSNDMKNHLKVDHQVSEEMTNELCTILSYFYAEGIDSDGITIIRCTLDNCKTDLGKCNAYILMKHLEDNHQLDFGIKITG